MDAAAVLKERFELREITPGKYRTMGSLMMRFRLEQYEVDGLGNLCVLRTKAMLGLMKLVTVVVTPSSGKNVPFLLIDTMDMGKKHLCYVEYYDCTAAGADRDLLLAAGAPYADVADYAEKPAWYVSERMAGSLIKTGDRARLEQMALDALAAYREQAAAAPVNAENIVGLRAFQRRMVREGNPSTAALTRTLGKEGAEAFFQTVVMPV
ncbi:MAG: hypothetical protein IKE11_07985 [Clostridia bacterium]|nr:hypothetical protein [Clostridia bacterium]